jgi:DNA (cytosine-5)-methyltransferase 1
MRKMHVNSFKLSRFENPADWMVVDNFAGGGGASTGIKMAIGRDPDAGINHNAEALAIYIANHPDSRTYKTSVWETDPRVVVRNRKVGLAHFSPDCTDFSKAKGGKPKRDKSRKSRALAWIVVKWARRTKPRVISLENVEEWLDWGPLRAKKHKNGKPVMDAEGPVLEVDPDKRGTFFDKWKSQLEKLGYRVEWCELRGCDYGSPTIRKRLFVMARCDGDPIVWPLPTHRHPDSVWVKRRMCKSWPTAADQIDWSIPCPSIFLTNEEATRLRRETGIRCNRPLDDNTMRRIAKGTFRYVINSQKPFIVYGNHGGKWFRGRGVDEPLATLTASRDAIDLINPVLAPVATHAQQNGRNRPIDAPYHTVTASEKDQNAVIVPILDPTYGNSAGRPVDQPAPTIMPGGMGKISLIAPIVNTYHGDRPDGSVNRGAELDEPLKTQDTSNRHALVQAFLSQHNTGVVGHHPEKPLSTITLAGSQQAVVEAAFIAQHNGGTVGYECTDPLGTLTQRSTQHSLTSAMLTHAYTSNTCGGEGDPTKPLKTIMAGGNHHAAVMAFLQMYYSEGTDLQKVDKPIHTIPTRDRFGLVTVNAIEYMIVDIGMRLLTSRELYNCQGFPKDYKIDVWCDDRRNKDGKRLKPGLLTKEAQVRCVGNSVCPQVMEALINANCPYLLMKNAHPSKQRRKRQLELAI